MERKFVITADNFVGEVIYTYNSKGNLVNVNWGYKEVNNVTKKFFYDNVPRRIEQFEVWLNEEQKDFFIKEIPPNLDFENFWSEYGKIGTKSTSKKKYDKLTDAEKLKAFLFLPQFRDIKKKDGTAMPYAETYINQKRWE